jgi:hypothetical protein
MPSVGCGQRTAGLAVSMAAATEIDCLASIIAAADGAGSPGERFPSLDDALARLADIPARDALAASRRLALEDLMRAEPAYAADGPKRELVARALAAGGSAAEDPVGELLANPRRDVTTGWLRRVVTGDGNIDAVTVLASELPLPDVSPDEVEPVLNPVNWLRCYDKWWTGMTLKEPGQSQRHYVEQVAGRTPSLKVEVCLRFVRYDGPDDVAILEFQKCDVESHQPRDCRVVVDEGSVEAKQRGDGVVITTSKRIQFADPFNDGPFLSVSAPGLGYTELARELVHACIGCPQAKSWEREEHGDGR